MPQSVDRYVAACAEATCDLDMGIVRSMVPTMNENGAGSSTGTRITTAGAHSELQLAPGVKNSRLGDEAGPSKRWDSRVSNRSDTATSTTRARSSVIALTKRVPTVPFRPPALLRLLNRRTVLQD